MYLEKIKLKNIYKTIQFKKIIKVWNIWFHAWRIESYSSICHLWINPWKI